MFLYHSLRVPFFCCVRLFLNAGGISEPGRVKSGLLLSYPQLPLHVGFQLGTQRFPAVWLDAVPEKPHQMPTPLAREEESVGWGKEGSKTPGLWLFFFLERGDGVLD